MKTKECDICPPPSSRRRTPPRPPFPRGSHSAFPGAPATGISPSRGGAGRGGPGETGEAWDGWGGLGGGGLSPLRGEPPTQASLPAEPLARGPDPRLRIEMAPRGGRAGRDVLGPPRAHPPPPRRGPLPLRGRRPAVSPTPAVSTSPLSSRFLDQSPPRGSPRRGVCDGAGVG